MKIIFIIPMFLTLGAGGCATQGRTSRPEASMRELLATDTAFSRMSEERGAEEAFCHFMAPSATLLPAGEAPVQGLDAIRKNLSGTQGVLRWQPVAGDVAASGDLGYTWGTYVYQGEGPDKKPRTTQGKYLTVWRRQRDGAWKWVLDCGNQSPAPGER